MAISPSPRTMPPTNDAPSKPLHTSVGFGGATVVVSLIVVLGTDTMVIVVPDDCAAVLIVVGTVGDVVPVVILPGMVAVFPVIGLVSETGGVVTVAGFWDPVVSKPTKQISLSFKFNINKHNSKWPGHLTRSLLETGRQVGFQKNNWTFYVLG